jgi:hypothetical protein
MTGDSAAAGCGPSRPPPQSVALAGGDDGQRAALKARQLGRQALLGGHLVDVANESTGLRCRCTVLRIRMRGSPSNERRQDSAAGG